MKTLFSLYLLSGKAIAVGIVMLVTGCATTGEVSQAPELLSSPAENYAILQEGYDVLTEQRFPRKAIEDYFDVVVERCDRLRAASSSTIYNARTLAETLYYTLLGDAESQTAEVLELPCGDAYYLKGYASVDLGDIGAAKRWVTEALEVSPANALYNAELGQILQLERDWSAALKLFQRAEQYAEAFSPSDVQQAELTRAMRGAGFSLIELGQLDAAEQKFLECLELDANDQNAKQELAYIQSVREKAAAPPQPASE